MVGIVVALLGVTTLAGQDASRQEPSDALRQLLDTRPDRGQNVAPVFEGWEPNPNGTFDLYFGYINRNWSETLDIPIGPGNSFSPGPPDRGQPTHFLPRRHKQIFKVTVPKDFGQQTLVWTLSIRGRTDTVPGSLQPAQQIDVSRHTESKNTPPAISVTSTGSARVGERLTFVAEVTDDGIPKRRPIADKDPRWALHVRWSKYRGPGDVTFASPLVAVEGGRASTTAVFSAPGDYVIQALADDGTMIATSQGQNVPGYACCWTTERVRVTVTGTISNR